MRVGVPGAVIYMPSGGLADGSRCHAAPYTVMSRSGRAACKPSSRAYTRRGKEVCSFPQRPPPAAPTYS